MQKILNKKHILAVSKEIPFPFYGVVHHEYCYGVHHTSFNLNAQCFTKKKMNDQLGNDDWCGSCAKKVIENGGVHPVGDIRDHMKDWENGVEYVNHKGKKTNSYDKVWEKILKKYGVKFGLRKQHILDIGEKFDVPTQHAYGLIQHMEENITETTTETKTKNKKNNKIIKHDKITNVTKHKEEYNIQLYPVKFYKDTVYVRKDVLFNGNHGCFAVLNLIDGVYYYYDNAYATFDDMHFTIITI
jgi:hypothetical protein